jgi:hypothetical protein
MGKESRLEPRASRTYVFTKLTSVAARAIVLEKIKKLCSKFHGERDDLNHVRHPHMFSQNDFGRIRLRS